MGIKRILIANRGEIALRIHRAAHEMGMFQTHALDLVRRAEPLVELGPVAQILHFHLRKGTALAGFHMVHLYGGPETTVMFQHVTGADFVTVDFGHG